VHDYDGDAMAPVHHAKRAFQARFSERDVRVCECLRSVSPKPGKLTGAGLPHPGTGATRRITGPNNVSASGYRVMATGRIAAI
jgi:hypothetical protein